METETTESQELQESSIWPETMWPEILAAAERVSKSTTELNDLILKYWKPLRIFLLFRFRHFPEIRNRADELLTEFAEDKVLREGWLKKANPGVGRFRNFLKTSLKNYVINRMSGRLPPESLDKLKADGFDPAAKRKEEASFDLGWAQTVLAEALDRLEHACNDQKRPQPRSSHIWEVFRLRILDPIFKGTKPAPYEKLVNELGLKSPTEGSNMLLTAKRMFKRLLEEVIEEYAGQDPVAKSELRALAELVERLAQTA